MHHFDLHEVSKVEEHLWTLDGEGNVRSAASRAYYGVFLVARELAGLEDRSAEVHRLTQQHFEDIGEQLIAEGLEFLRHRRNAADYQTKRLFSRRDAAEVIRRSRSVRAALTVVAGRMKYRHSS